MNEIKKNQHSKSNYPLVPRMPLARQDIIDCLPGKINLIQSATLRAGTSTFQAESDPDFEEHLTCWISLSGELKGRAFFFISPVYNKESELLDEYHSGLFVECSNIILKHLVDQIDEKFSILVHTSSPQLYTPRAKFSAKYHRMIELWIKTKNDQGATYFNYSLQYHHQKYTIWGIISLTSHQIGAIQ